MTKIYCKHILPQLSSICNNKQLFQCTYFSKQLLESCFLQVQDPKYQKKILIESI
jgi:hypothetical protein